MKKILLSVFILTGLGAFTQNVVFNDPALKQRIVAHDQAITGGVSGPGISLIDTDFNGEISITEAQAYTGRLYLNQGGTDFFTDLTGVEEFINITELFCENNQMTTLDVSSNVELTGLHCENNQISTLNLANNVDLEILNYRYNSITTISLASNLNLTNLTCTNNGISSINLAVNTNLEVIDISDNSLTSLDLTTHSNLFSITANNNSLSSLMLPTTSVLETIQVNTNALNTVSLTNQADLVYLEVNDNVLTTLDVSPCVILDYLSIKNNQITTLDLSANVDLTVLEANNNSLSTYIGTNSMEFLVVVDNNLTSLDFSAAPNLVYLDCSNNDLDNLNVANTNNTSLTIVATGNANLMCIGVDDEAYSTSNWTNIDAQTSFSVNCPVLVNDVTVSGQGGASTITTDGGTLQMMADVLPANATDNTYTWSVTNGTGAATIDAAGLLTATHNGTVTVIATANDGSGVTGSEIVTISNQTAASINSNNVALEISMYPNPTTGIVNFETTTQIKLIEVYNLIGEKVNFVSNVSTINIQELPNGIYVVNITTNEGVSVTKKLVKK